jgi:hypothetical protein
MVIAYLSNRIGFESSALRLQSLWGATTGDADVH